MPDEHGTPIIAAAGTLDAVKGLLTELEECDQTAAAPGSLTGESERQQRHDIYARIWEVIHDHEETSPRVRRKTWSS